MPGPLAADQAAILSPEGPPKNPFSFSLKGVKDKPFFRQGPGGTVQIADSRNFLANTFVAASLVTLIPGGLRELHWHPNADEWQYYISGRARVGVFGSHGRARLEEFGAGDVGYVPQGYGHYIENAGTEDVEALIVLNNGNYQSISLTAWMAANPHLLLSTNFRVPESTFASFPKSERFMPG